MVASRLGPRTRDLQRFIPQNTGKWVSARTGRAPAFVDALPDDLAPQITRQNALRLYRLPAAA
jgi:hypothetical protein